MWRLLFQVYIVAICKFLCLEILHNCLAFIKPMTPFFFFFLSLPSTLSSNHHGPFYLPLYSLCSLFFPLVHALISNFKNSPLDARLFEGDSPSSLM